MATKTDFTTDEWKMILGSPMMAGMAVTLGDPSGLWGTMKEGMASGNALLEAKAATGTNALVKELVAAMETPEGRAAARDGIKAQVAGKPLTEIKAQLLSSLALVGKTLDTKAPQDSAPFKNWLGHVAEKVAEASSEGGFLGIGGVQVSEAETATIAEMKKALGIH
jgi:hypothetical protein